MSSNSIDNAIMDIAAPKTGRANAGAQARSSSSQVSPRAFSGMLDDELGAPDPVAAPKDSPPQYTYTVSAAPTVAAIEATREQGAAVGGEAVEAAGAISSGAFTTRVGQSLPSQQGSTETGVEGDAFLQLASDGSVEAGAALDGELLAAAAPDGAGEAGVDEAVLPPKFSAAFASAVQAEAGGAAKVMAASDADPAVALPMMPDAQVVTDAQVATETQVTPDAQAAADASAAELAANLQTTVKAPDARPVQTAPAQEGGAEAVPVPAGDAAVAEADAAAVAKPTTSADVEDAARNSASTQQVTGAAAVAATLAVKDGEGITDEPVAPATAAVPPIARTPTAAEGEALADGSAERNLQKNLSEGASRDSAKPNAEAFAENVRGDAEAAARRPAAEARVGEPTSKHIMLPESMAATALTPAAAAPTQAVTPHLAAGTMPAVTLAVASEMVAQHRAGVSRFEIRLDPPELGRIDVRLDVDKAGNVRSHLIVERSETLDMLRADQRNLERTLEQAGFKSDPNGISMSLKDHGTGSGQNGRMFEATMTRGNEAAVMEEPQPVPGVTSSGTSSASSNLDIRV